MAHRGFGGGGFHGGFRRPGVIIEPGRPEIVIGAPGYVAPAPYYGPVTYLGPIPSAIITVIFLLIIMMIIYSMFFGASNFEPYKGNFGTKQRVVYLQPPPKKKTRFVQMPPNPLQMSPGRNPTVPQLGQMGRYGGNSQLNPGQFYT